MLLMKIEDHWVLLDDELSEVNAMKTELKMKTITFEAKNKAL